LPACVTVNVRPAAVSVPVRSDAVLFASTVKLTDPEPVRLAPAVMSIHEALLVAVHAHDDVVVTLVVPVPPVAAVDKVVGEIENVQLPAD
jgi:hypothetical protein